MLEILAGGAAAEEHPGYVGATRGIERAATVRASPDAAP